MKAKAREVAVFVMSLTFAATAGFAQPPGAPAEKTKHKASNSEEGISHSTEGEVSAHVYFTDERIRLIAEYYSGHRSASGCPPGLAKKGNGCRPPGQARKWRVGAPLPGDVIYYDVPDSLVVELGMSDRSRKIVRVGTDLLLIAVATGMVIDAVEDLDEVF